jgi:hypothetical protein
MFPVVLAPAKKALKSSFIQYEQWDAGAQDHVGRPRIVEEQVETQASANAFYAGADNYFS